MRQWLNRETLSAMPHERFEDEIVDVVEEVINNRFAGKKQPEPVIPFNDGWRLIPNLAMRQQLVTLFGHETNMWRGRHVVVYLHKVSRTDKVTGEVRERVEKRLMKSGTDRGVVTTFAKRATR
jgi:hypothetical protein